MSNSRHMAGTRLILRIRRCWSGSSSLTTRTGILSRRGVVITVRHGRLQQRSSPGSPPPAGMTRRSQPGSASPSRPPHLRYPRKHSVQGIAIAGPRRLTVTPGPGSDLSYLAGIALVISAFWHHHNWPCETLLADGTRAGRRDPTFVVCRTPPPRGQADARAYPAAAPAARRTAGKRALTCICPGGTPRWARDRLSLPR